MKQFVPSAAKALLSLLLCSSTCISAHAANCVVNLSHYDEETVHFARMHSEGVAGVIHEASYPRAEKDARYAAREIEARRAGLLWGAYHFGDGSDPVRQADHFLDTVRASWRKCPPALRGSGVLLVLDFEQNTHYPAGTMGVRQAAAFADRVKERTGNYPGLYASENRIKEVINGPQGDAIARRDLARCWLWIANYHYQPRATAPWTNWTLWQYTGDGICDLPRKSYPISVANIRKAERNMFTGSTAAMKSFWKDHAWVPEG